MRCSCMKKESRCGPGCTCRDCKNTITDETEVHVDSESESSESDEENTENIETEVVTGLEYEYDEMLDMQT